MTAKIMLNLHRFQMEVVLNNWQLCTELPKKCFLNCIWVQCSHQARVHHQLLEHEFCILKTLGRGVGFPIVHWFDSEEDYNAVIFDHLGPSLEDLFVHSNYKFL